MNKVVTSSLLYPCEVWNMSYLNLQLRISSTDLLKDRLNLVSCTSCPDQAGNTEFFVLCITELVGKLSFSSELILFCCSFCWGEICAFLLFGGAMAALSPSESRRLYSWWWDSHNSPKNSKWLQDNLTGWCLYTSWSSLHYLAMLLCINRFFHSRFQ